MSTFPTASTAFRTAARAHSDLVLASFEEWAGFDGTGEGWRRAEAIDPTALALAVLYDLDDSGDAFRWLTDHHGSESNVFRAHPELCPECGGHGVVETRRVVGTWASDNGPGLSIDEHACPVCCGGAR